MHFNVLCNIYGHQLGIPICDCSYVIELHVQLFTHAFVMWLQAYSLRWYVILRRTWRTGWRMLWLVFQMKWSNPRLTKVDFMSFMVCLRSGTFHLKYSLWIEYLKYHWVIHCNIIISIISINIIIKTSYLILVALCVDVSCIAAYNNALKCFLIDFILYNLSTQFLSMLRK